MLLLDGRGAKNLWQEIARNSRGWEGAVLGERERLMALGGDKGVKVKVKVSALMKICLIYVNLGSTSYYKGCFNHLHGAHCIDRNDEIFLLT